MRQYEEGRLQMNDDDDEEYGYGFKKSTHANNRTPTLLKNILRNSSIT